MALKKIRRVKTVTLHYLHLDQDEEVPASTPLIVPLPGMDFGSDAGGVTGMGYIQWETPHGNLTEIPYWFRETFEDMPESPIKEWEAQATVMEAKDVPVGMVMLIEGESTGYRSKTDEHVRLHLVQVIDKD